MLTDILSSIGSETTSDFVYSSLGFYAGRRGGELPGPWFVRALGSIGVEENAIRQTLYRMTRSGTLETRREGRMKLYRASSTTQVVLRTGTARMLEDPEDGPEWDGRWTLVRFMLEKQDRKIRDQLRDILTVEGFAALGAGLYVHPRERTDRIMDAVRGVAWAGAIHVFRGERLTGPEEHRFVHDLWDLEATASRYRSFMARYGALEVSVGDHEPRNAFALRFGLVFEYLRITWDDPDLPHQLLPAGWPAVEARSLTQRLYGRLLPGAVEFADEVMAGLGSG
jgi:phenylacetic acid degradation operon negative regulatory protein